MPFIPTPSRNKTLQLAYALKDAEERKARKAAKKEPEPAAPAKRSNRKGAKK